MSALELRLGRWQDVLNDVECDALITDPPYSARTHGAYREMPQTGRRSIDYACMTPLDVAAFVAAWSPRTRGWMVVLTDHVLVPAWIEAMQYAGRYCFAPLACVEPGSRVRVCGDGPSNWTVYAIVSRPKNRTFQRWGALVGAYVCPVGSTRRGDYEGEGVMGGKPLWLMRALARDYSKPGDLICDPFGGGGTTLLAAAIEGRLSVGAEADPKTHALAAKRLARPFTPSLFLESGSSAVQEELFT